LRLWRAIEAEREINFHGSYIYRIAVSVTINAIRRAKARREERLRLTEAWSDRGLVWFAKSDFTHAIADFDQALRLNPGLVESYGNRGLARLMQGKLAEAEADFARCRSLGGSPKPDAEALLREMKGRGVSK
jgi:tetratricopeptide (TPR) repeat protein